jgi:hypothetical protein
MKTELKFSLFLFLLIFLILLALIIFPWQKLTPLKGDKGHGLGEHHPHALSLGGLELGLVFLTGLLGGAHCLGMCGGIVAAYSFRLNNRKKRGYGILNHLLFNSGRLISYMIIGITMGTAGSMIMKAPWFSSWQRMVPLLLGVTMLFMALSLGGVLPRRWNIFDFPSLESAEGPGILERLVGKVLARPSVLSLVVLGILVGFLPCGLVYTVALKAAASGSFWGGMFTMTLFGLGTWPALGILGVASWRFSIFTAPRYRLWAYRLAAVTIALLGVLTLIRGVFFRV